MAQPGDEALSCQALKQQIAANRAVAEKFIHQDKKVEEQNAAKNVGMAVPWVGLLLIASLDLSNKEQIEARALIDRNERLTLLAKQKGCAE